MAMTLKEYFDEYKVSVNRFCRDNDLNYFTIRKIVLGYDCLLSTAIMIEIATKGLVTCNSLRPTLAKPVREKLLRSEVYLAKIKDKTAGTQTHKDKDPK